MGRYFNIAGPCNKTEHYMIEASTRLSGVEQLIDMKQINFSVIASLRSNPNKNTDIHLTASLRLHVILSGV